MLAAPQVSLGGKIKAVLTTAEADSARMEEALANGADGYLMKPFTASILVDAIANLDPHA